MSNPVTTTIACPGCGCGPGRFRRLKNCVDDSSSTFWVDSTDSQFAQFFNSFTFFQNINATHCLYRGGEASDTLPNGHSIIRPVASDPRFQSLPQAVCAGKCCPTCIIASSLKICKALLSFDWTSCGCAYCNGASETIFRSQIVSGGTSELNIPLVGNGTTCGDSAVKALGGTSQCYDTFGTGPLGVTVYCNELQSSGGVNAEGIVQLQHDFNDDTIELFAQISIGPSSNICGFGGSGRVTCVRAQAGGIVRAPRTSFAYGSVYDIPFQPYVNGNPPGNRPMPCSTYTHTSNLWNNANYYPVGVVNRLSVALL
jgi:hypothetical protein